jgi:hypothetical protein
MEIRQVGAMLTDRTDVAKIIVAFRNYANAPEKRNHVHLLLRCELTVFLVSLEVVIIQGFHGGGICWRYVKKLNFRFLT